MNLLVLVVLTLASLTVKSCDGAIATNNNLLLNALLGRRLGFIFPVRSNQASKVANAAAASSSKSTTVAPVVSTTTPKPDSLCPATPVPRSLNAQSVQTTSDGCSFNQVASIISSNGNTVACNAALTRAKVNGVMKTTFVTSSLCTSLVDQLAKDPSAGLTLQFGGVDFDLKTSFKTVKGSNGAAFLDVPANSPVLAGLSECEQPACSYNPSTMEGQVDMSDCKMVSYGATDDQDFTFKGKREVSLKEKPSGCSSLPDLFGAANTMCLESSTGESVFCIGDSGAPTYCKSLTTDEWILIGVAALQTECGGSSEIKIIPVPQ